MFFIDHSPNQLFSETIRSITIDNKTIRSYNIITAGLSSPYFLGLSMPESNPDISSNSYDIFKHLDQNQLNSLKTDKNTFFVFNYTLEGDSYTHYNFYQLLTLSAIKHNIPCERIFFLSSNLFEEKTYILGN